MPWETLAYVCKGNFMIGIDIVEIARFRNMEESDCFVRRVFTANETAYLVKKQYSAETIAGMFAAKEAAAKALKCGLAKAGMKNIEILHESGGAPYYVLHGEALRLLNGKSIHLSISHSGIEAIAAAYITE